MRYRVTCLTPTLAGDGQKLAPIDYMVWKDHINVLDQQKIFRILAKGPRLEPYLAQLKRASTLDFQSWGGFAQNYAGRRIAFEDPSVVAVWEKQPPENLFIPSFADSPSGPYLPATVIKGALRTGAIFERWSDATLRDLAQKSGLSDSESARLPRNASVKAEESALGAGAKNRMRAIGAGDSAAIGYGAMRIYVSRTATLVAGAKPAVRGGANPAAPVARPAGYQLGWKSSRGTVEDRRLADATPVFTEMAVPGCTFEGAWNENSSEERAQLFAASNKFAAAQLARHKQFAQQTGLASLAGSIQQIESSLAGAVSRKDACLLAIGWGAGMLSKLSVSDTGSEEFRSIARRVALYGKALRTGMPFPKTRRIVFESGAATQLPGWVLLEVLS